MRASFEDVMDLLNKFREEKAWLYVVFIGEDEEHRFRCQVDAFSDNWVKMSGIFCLLAIPLESAIFEYTEPREAPRPEKFEGKFDSCLDIRSEKVRALLLYAET